jgi:hypothetical protein
MPALQIQQPYAVRLHRFRMTRNPENERPKSNEI